MVGGITVPRTGGPEVLTWTPFELPSPGPGEVRVRHTAVGVNYIDTYHRGGLYPLPSLPHGIGVEAAGEVDAVGPDVGELRPGERVAYVSGVPGSYCTHRVVPADRVVPIPHGVTDEVAAATILKGMTAEYLIHRCVGEVGISPDQRTVLVLAAAGGTGSLLCQWLSARGARVIGAAGSEEKAALCRNHGCDEVILYRDEPIAERVRAITGGEGVDVVFDAVGRATFEACLDSLRPRGRMVAFGNASGAPPPIDLLELSRRGSLMITRPTLFDFIRTPRELATSSSRVFDALRKGTLRPAIDQRFPLRDAAEAHRTLEARQTTGATVLLP